MDGYHNPQISAPPPIPQGSNAKTCKETWARIRLQMLAIKYPDKTILQLAKMVDLTAVEADAFLNCAMNRLDL